MKDIQQQINKLRKEIESMAQYVGADVDSVMEDVDTQLATLLLSVQDEQKEKVSKHIESLTFFGKVDPGNLRGDQIRNAPYAWEPKTEEV